MRKSNYDKFPCVPVPGGEQACVTGWDEIATRLNQAIAQGARRKTVLVVECYPGVEEEEVLRELQARLKPTSTFRGRAVPRRRRSSVWLSERADAAAVLQ